MGKRIKPEIDHPGDGALRNELDELREKLRRADAQIEELRLLEASMLMAQVQTVEAFVTSIEAKDEYTSGHSRRVAELSLMVGAAIGLNADRMWKLNLGALLHDVGKIGVYDSSLQKTTRLSDEEFLQLKEHPVTGEGIINRIDAFKDIAPLVRSHHERFDGNGYPDELTGDQIPIESAIICAADAFDAITSKRTYNKPLTTVEAVEELARNSGTQFNPKVVEALRKALEPNEVTSVSISESDFVDFEIPDEIEQPRS